MNAWFGSCLSMCRRAENFIEGKKSEMVPLKLNFLQKTRKAHVFFCINTQKGVSKCFIFSTICLENLLKLVYSPPFGKRVLEIQYFTPFHNLAEAKRKLIVEVLIHADFSILM